MLFLFIAINEGATKNSLNNVLEYGYVDLKKNFHIPNLQTGIDISNFQNFISKFNTNDLKEIRDCPWENPTKKISKKSSLKTFFKFISILETSSHTIYNEFCAEGYTFESSDSNLMSAEEMHKDLICYTRVLVSFVLYYNYFNKSSLSYIPKQTFDNCKWVIKKVEEISSLELEHLSIFAECLVERGDNTKENTSWLSNYYSNLKKEGPSETISKRVLRKELIILCLDFVYKAHTVVINNTKKNGKSIVINNVKKFPLNESIDDFRNEILAKDSEIRCSPLLVINASFARSLELEYSGLGVNFYPSSTNYKEGLDFTVKNVIENSSYSKKLWKNKGENGSERFKTENLKKSGFLDENCNNIEKFLFCINFLQQTGFLINKDFVSYVNQNANDFNFLPFKFKNDLELAAQNRYRENEVMAIFPTIKPDDNEITPDKLQELRIDNYLAASIGKYFSFTATNRLMALVQQWSEYFFYNYEIDHRTRTYPQSYILNYQLNKQARSSVYFDASFNEISETYVKFFEVNPLLLNYEQIFTYQHLRKMDPRILNLIEEFFIKPRKLIFDIQTINIVWNSDFISLSSLIEIKDYRESLIYLEFASNTLDRLWSTFGNSAFFEEKDMRDILKIIKDGNTIDILKLYDIKEKDYFEALSFVFELNKYLNDSSIIWLDMTWYNDASSNVVQLLLLKTFTHDEKLLKIANIFNNDTEYKNIYSYLASKVKKILLEAPIAEGEQEWVTKDLIKGVVMPGSYGQTEYSLVEGFKKLLKDDKNWALLKGKDQNNWAVAVGDVCWGILKEQGFDIKAYLTLCKDVYYASNYYYWFSPYQMPIILEKPLTVKKLKSLEKSQTVYAVRNKLNYILDQKEEFLKFHTSLDKKTRKSKKKSYNTNDEDGARRVDVDSLTKQISRFRVDRNKFEKWSDDFGKKNVMSKKIYEDLSDEERLTFAFCSQGWKELNKACIRHDKQIKLLNKKSFRKEFKLLLREAVELSNNKSFDYSTISDYSKKRRIRENPLELPRLDVNKLINNISPSSNHADDASIMYFTVLDFARLKIKCSVIHDSIGTHPAYSSLSKLAFKTSIIDYVDILLEEDRFPFNILKHEFTNEMGNSIVADEEMRKLFMEKRSINKEFYIKNRLAIIEKILQSHNLFN